MPEERPTPDGRIKAFPAQERKYLVLVRYVLKAFEPGVKYTEKRVNRILKHYNDGRWRTDPVTRNETAAGAVGPAAVKCTG